MLAGCGRRYICAKAAGVLFRLLAGYQFWHLLTQSTCTQAGGCSILLAVVYCLHHRLWAHAKPISAPAATCSLTLTWVWHTTTIRIHPTVVDPLKVSGLALHLAHTLHP